MNDADAILKCREGDRDAFRDLVTQYQSQALGHAVAILGNRDDAMDAVQEAFIDAFQALARFDITRRFYPWFYAILRNRCFKILSNRKHHEADSTDDVEILSPSPGASREELLLLERGLIALSAEHREIITLKHLDGLSYEELSARLEIPIGTVMSRLHHARKNLREKLSRHFKKVNEP